jgi:PIN domain nuclease of toxin-antitoxin system
VAEVVLDASALLALLNAEPGSELVSAALPGAAMSSVNYSEVVARLSDSGLPPKEIRLALDGLGLDVLGFDEEQAFAAGLLRPATRAAGLGLGDRACLSLGVLHLKPVLTADRAWQGLKLNVEVRMVR